MKKGAGEIRAARLEQDMQELGVTLNQIKLAIDQFLLGLKRNMSESGRTFNLLGITRIVAGMIFVSGVLRKGKMQAPVSFRIKATNGKITDCARVGGHGGKGHGSCLRGY